MQQANDVRDERTVAPGDQVRIRIRRPCDGGGKPHHRAEDGHRGEVTVVHDDDRDHPIFALWRGTPEPRPHGRPPGLGRFFAVDELEIIERRL